MTMCERFSLVKERLFLFLDPGSGSGFEDAGRFQLESLILAQNERWRQA
jgi:hypothetical protein